LVVALAHLLAQALAGGVVVIVLALAPNLFDNDDNNNHDGKDNKDDNFVYPLPPLPSLQK
jgi:hypothetical protein